MNPNDRYLTFTLSGAALADPLPNPDGTTSHSTSPASNAGQVAGYLPQAGEGVNVTAAGSSFGPHDAFEVALLDANSGASLLGSDGLTRKDAFLNTRKGYAGGSPAAWRRPSRSLQADGSVNSTVASAASGLPTFGA